MRLTSLFIILALLLSYSIAVAQENQSPFQIKPARIVVTDAVGQKAEEFLSVYSKELAVSKKDRQEKSFPLKTIEFINEFVKVNKVKPGIPGAGRMTGEEYTSVRYENIQELYNLENKYTLSLNTSLGVVTKKLEPGQLSRDPSASGRPFIRDKNILFSLEFKF